MLQHLGQLQCCKRQQRSTFSLTLTSATINSKHNSNAGHVCVDAERDYFKSCSRSHIAISTDVQVTTVY
jgi:hypothetical protein